MEVLGVLIFALSGGLIMSRVVKFLHLPNVTGYLIAGLILGGHCLKLVDYNASPIIHDSISTITSVALGFIAFSIGGEFKIEHLKKLGSKVLTITVVQAVFAVGLTMLGLFVLNLVSPGSAEMPVILLLGAISAATAPAATLMGP